MKSLGQMMEEEAAAEVLNRHAVMTINRVVEGIKDGRLEIVVRSVERDHGDKRSAMVTTIVARLGHNYEITLKDIGE